MMRLTKIFIIVGGLAAMAGAYAVIRALRGTSEPVQVHFVVPDGYRGQFQISRHPGATAPQRRADGTFVYQIPDSGLLQVDGANPLAEWHDTTAAYRDGSALPFQGGSGAPADPQVKLRSVSADHLGNVYYVVGTGPEHEHLVRTSDHALGRVAATP